MFKRSITLLVAIFALASPAHAIFGVGDTVFDAQAYMQQLINYATQVQQYTTQVQQYQTQIRQLNNEYDNLRNLGYQIDLSSLDEMQNVMKSSTGISNDFGKMQTQFQQLYPDFKTYQGQKSVDYAKQSVEWSKVNQQNAQDILTVTAKVQEAIARDQQNLRYLSDRSDSASGAKDLLQTLNQLLIMQTKQLMQLQQLIATSAKADAAYLAQKSSNDEASRAGTTNLFKGWSNKGNRTPAPHPKDVLK